MHIKNAIHHQIATGIDLNPHSLGVATTTIPRLDLLEPLPAVILTNNSVANTEKTIHGLGHIERTMMLRVTSNSTVVTLRVIELITVFVEIHDNKTIGSAEVIDHLVVV